MATLDDSQTAAMIEAGILAPSADNRHMVRFELGDDTICLRGSPDWASAPFHRRILGLISLGAMVENMVLRGAQIGVRAEIGWSIGAARSEPLATLKLTPSEPRDCHLAAAIARRHTNRRVMFRGPRLTAAQQNEINADVAAIEGVHLSWLDEPDTRRKALRLILIAEAERFRSRPLHQDLFSGIRFDLGWRATSSEGLPPGSLEIEPPMRPLFKALRNWSAMRFLACMGVHRGIGLRGAYVPCRLAPHVCVLATTQQIEHGAVAVGKALERIWLRATNLGLAFQPLAASAILALDDYADVERDVRSGLAEGWRGITPNALPLIVFRMGYARPASLRAGRPEIRALMARTDRQSDPLPL